MPDPITGAGFNAPTPEAAYRAAPSPVREAADLERIAADLQAGAADASRAGGPSAADEYAVRLYLLRRAALADRLSLASPDDPHLLEDAAGLSLELIGFDREHHTHTGPIGPGATQWAPSARLYVRQEYDHWGW